MGAYGKKHNISHFSLVVDICTFACRERRGKKECGNVTQGKQTYSSLKHTQVFICSISCS